MHSIRTRINQGYGRVLHSPGPTVVSLLLLLIIWLGQTSPANALSALSFDGDDDYAYVAFDPGASFTQMTLQVWVKPERFDPPRETFAGWIRAVDQLPPKSGFTKTQESKILLYQNKSDWTRWGFYVSTANTADGSPAGMTDIPATKFFDRTEPERWHHLAVTYDGRTGGSGTVILYQDGDIAGSSTAVPGEMISNILSIWFGRWVAATAGDMGTVSIHSRVLSQQEIRANMSCGVNSASDDLFAYWPLDEGSGHVITDTSGNGHNGYLGDQRQGDRSEPQWVPANYLTTSGDRDGDGIPDNCDNCPDFASDNQEDRDGDGFGTVCDLCPQTPNNDEDGDGLADPCDVIAQTSTRLVGGSVVSTTEWLGPDAYWVPPDIDTVQLICCQGSCLEGDQVNWDHVVRTNCLYTDPKVISVVEELEDSGYGSPGGDAKPVTAYQSENVAFDLFKWFSPQDLSKITECTTRYISYREFRGMNYETGECYADVCPDPDIPSYQIFIGASNVNLTPVSLRGIELDIKPCSTPSCFGMTGSGVVPVAIHSTATFDARTVNPQTVRLGINPGEASCEPRDWSISQLPCVPGNHLILHFEKSCLRDIGIDTATKTLSISGSLYDGTGIFGSDEVCVQNE